MGVGMTVAILCPRPRPKLPSMPRSIRLPLVIPDIQITDTSTEPVAELPLRDEWIQTFTGKAFPIWNPKPEHIVIEDIAHALSNMCRYGGHTNSFYSVAQHSVLVAWALRNRPLDLVKTALLHDASEAYLIDVPTPIKRSLPDYKVIERKIMTVICERFGVPVDALDSPVIHWADKVVLVTEYRDLMSHTCERKWLANLDIYPPMEERISAVAPPVAESEFLAAAERLGLR